MRKLSKIGFLFLLLITFEIWSLMFEAQSSIAQVPQINLSCSETDSPEFNSLRPYQAAPCGEAPVARFCSNRLVVFEDFDMKSACESQRQHETGSWTCEVPEDKGYIGPHDLNITLNESDFPIMGNTEDELDDATKMNEYASWYLSGVIDKKENIEPTNDQVVNFSGPLKKLLPSMIQDQQRINIIKTPLTPVTVTEEDDGSSTKDMENHDQDVVGNLKLTDWNGSLSFVRSVTNIIGNIVDNLLKAEGIEFQVGGWNHAFPPLPWDDGTGAFDNSTGKWLPGKPFESQDQYLKAYNEWKGKSCMTVPIFGLICVDNPLITNKFADLWHFVPLSNNSDKKGKNYLLTGDGPNYVPSAGTQITGQKHKSYLNAPLYFPHTEEVKGLSGLLNNMFQPDGFKEEGLGYPADVEKIKIGTGPAVTPAPGTLSPDKQGVINSTDPYDHLQCSNVNVRVNKGDYLFPGNRDQEGTDSKELFVEDVEYTITQVECDEVWEKIEIECTENDTPNDKGRCFTFEDSLICNAQVGIEFKLGTKTPWVDEIFKNTVAGTGSTFRKIFPKVEEGAPVECIADIPTVTKVKYSNKNSFNQKPPKGSQSEVLVTNYPDDGAGGTQLTFPHVGSVYEYFLNGIQTALRPKGYGGTIASGNCGQPTDSIICGELPEGLPEATGACNLGSSSSRVGDIPESLKSIVSAAAETYKVHPNMILALMYGEGAFNQAPYQKYDWTEENVKNWATCEPLPNCTGPQTSIISGLALNWSSHVDNVFEDLKKIDPTKTRESIDGCNLIDEVYIIANMIRGAAGGGVDLTGKQCYGITMGSYIPQSCGEWDSARGDSMIQTALRVYQLGAYWTPQSSTANVACPYPGGCNCATLPGSCATGGGIRAGCDKPGDACEKNGGSGNTSHNACVFDVAKGR